MKRDRSLPSLFLLCACLLSGAQASRLQAGQTATGMVAFQSSPVSSEYLWYETENMHGISADARHEPVLNPSWMELSASKAPGWGINGPGVSAEWSQGGESEWNSVNASADETRATIWQDIEVPRAGDYKVWVRYADWANKSESFVVTITQNGFRSKPGTTMSFAPGEVFRHEFGEHDIIDPHEETKMY